MSFDARSSLRWVQLLIAVAVVSGVLAAPALAGAGSGRYIVVLEDSVSHPGAVAEDQAEVVGAEVSLVFRTALKGYAATLPKDQVEELERDPRVAYVTPDRKVKAFGQATPTGIERIGALDNPSIDIDQTDDVRIDADVAVIDSGIDYTHPDLNVYARTDCVPADEEEELAVCVDDSGTDRNGHGTHVAGTIGALDNDYGVVGVAPGVRLWAVRVLDASRSGYESWIVAGVDWVAVHSAQIEVANMSLGCWCGLPALDEAIESAAAKGVVFTVAAGNTGWYTEWTSPASNPDVITVSALADYDGRVGGKAEPTCEDAGPDDHLASFSNFGPEVDVAAPGVCIESTLPGNAYGTYSGTSMAAPHVAGAVAILTSASKPTSLKDVEGVRQALSEYGRYDWIDDSRDGSLEPALYAGPLVTIADTRTAANLDKGSATLKGTVAPGGLSTDYHFEYGLTTAYGQTTTSKSAGSGYPNVQVSEAVTGLLEDRSYHYRLVATNSAGTFYGQDHGFHTSRWQRMTSMPSLGSPVDVSCSSPSACTAVSPEAEAARRWDGTSWSSQAIHKPSGAERTWLERVSCPVRSNSCMAIGRYLSNVPGANYHGLVERWNGTSWSALTPALPSGAKNLYLRDVSCPSVNWCMVIGDIEGGPNEHLIAVWDGVSWTYQPAPPLKDAGYRGADLRAVSCPAVNSCTIVGMSMTLAAPQHDVNFSANWAGGEWSFPETPLPAADRHEEESLFGMFTDVSCVTAFECSAVGYVERFHPNMPNAEPERQGLAGQWDGSKWTLSDPASGVLKGVSCISIDICVAVGDSAMVRWDGSGWQPLRLPSSDGLEAPFQMASVSCETSRCIAVGLDETGHALAESLELLLPQAVTVASETTSSTTATVYGRVNPQGVSTTYRFQYGKTAAYGSSVPAVDEAVGAGTSDVPVNQAIAGLDPDTTYHYRLVATGPEGTVAGADESFTTPHPPPSFDFGFGEEGEGEGQFQSPSGVATDAEGNLWVADTLNNRVQEFSSKGEFLQQFGWPGSGPGDLDAPVGIAVSPEGNVWVADSGNNRVQEFGPSGEFIRQAGSGYLDHPTGVAIDSGGDVWVASTGSNRLVEFSSEGAPRFGIGAGWGYGSFNAPVSLVADDEGSIWIADTGDLWIQKYNSTTHTYQGGLGVAGGGPGEFSGIGGLALDPVGDLWVADWVSCRVQKFDQATHEFLMRFGECGSEPGQLGGMPKGPGLAIGPEGEIWILNSSRNEIQKWVPTP